MSMPTPKERAATWLAAYKKDEVELTEDALEALLQDTYRDALEQTPRDIVEALRFYADPETYFAIGFFPDAGCGPFMQDFEEINAQLGRKPGKKARDVCEKILSNLPKEESA